MFVLGLVSASFLGALMYRLEVKMKIKDLLFSRSHCDNCNRELAWYELIPIFSWIFSLGRCRTCGEKISVFYPLSELFLGIGFVLIYKYYYLNFWPYLFLSLLFSLSYYDFISKSIPKWLTHITLIFGFIFFIFNFSTLKLISLEYFLILTLFILILNKIRKSFGFGDILIFAFFALILNPIPYLIFLLTTLYLSALGGIVLIFLNKKNIKAYIPLVPFMTVAYVMAPFLEPFYLKIFYLLLN